MVKVTGVDKRTGKLIYDKEFTQSTPFHALKIDPQAGLIELVRQDLKIALRADDGQSARAGGDPHPAAGAVAVPARRVNLRR
jgi:hypothetical protein